MGPPEWADKWTTNQQYVVKQDDWCKELRSLSTPKGKMAAKMIPQFYGNNSTASGTAQYINFFTTTDSTGADSTNVWTIDYTTTDFKIDMSNIKKPFYVTSPPIPQARPDPRILNKYLNASDLLEEFILEMKPLGIRQNEVLSVPIELFINWLIIRSAEEDGLDAPALPCLPDKRRDRCWDCGKFITLEQRQAGMFFCNGTHFDRYVLRDAA